MQWYELYYRSSRDKVMPEAIKKTVTACWTEYDIKNWSYEEQVKILRALDALWRTKPTAKGIASLESKAEELLKSSDEVEAREKMAREEAEAQEERRRLDAWDARRRRDLEEANAAEASKRKRKKATGEC